MESDLELATRVAQHAGRLVLDLRESFGSFDPDDRQTRMRLKDQADLLANDYIVSTLSQARPQDAILSEEQLDGIGRDDAQRLWIVDPLDGTSEYSQGRADFAIHIALWDRAAVTPEKLLVGVVDLPAQDLTRTTGDGVPLVQHVSSDGPVRIVVSRSRPPRLAAAGESALARELAAAGITDHGVQFVRVGSVGAKVNELLSGRADAYVHDTGFNEWDVAAPLIVGQHYGLDITHIDGAPVEFNHRPPWVPNLLVCPPVLTPLLRSACAVI